LESNKEVIVVVEKQKGAWIPWQIAECLPRLSLRPASRWQVFMAVLTVWCRYGRGEAWLAVADIAAVTGLSKRTVQAAISELIALGLVERRGRYKRLVVKPEGLCELAHDQLPDVGQNRDGEAGHRSADKAASPTGEQDCASTICIGVLKEDNAGRRVFSGRQLTAIRRALSNASQLLGEDAGQLPLSPNEAKALNVPVGTSYSSTFNTVRTEGDAERAHRFTGAVLALRHDERIQGQELKGAHRG